MAEIVCIECKATVSDALAFCSECGYPFDSALAEQQEIAVDGDAAEVAATDADIAGVSVTDDVVADAGETDNGADAFDDAVAVNQEAAHITAPPPSQDMLQQTFDSLMAEMGELQRTLTDIRQRVDSHATISAENTQQALSAITLKLDELDRFNSKKEAEALAIAAKGSKKSLLAAFYKTLNSPNSMFDYMFYITVVQIIFVVVNLFLVAYIVTLVR